METSMRWRGYTFNLLPNLPDNFRPALLPRDEQTAEDGQSPPARAARREKPILASPDSGAHPPPHAERDNSA